MQEVYANFDIPERVLEAVAVLATAERVCAAGRSASARCSRPGRVGCDATRGDSSARRRPARVAERRRTSSRCGAARRVNRCRRGDGRLELDARDRSSRRDARVVAPASQPGVRVTAARACDGCVRTTATTSSTTRSRYRRRSTSRAVRIARSPTHLGAAQSPRSSAAAHAEQGRQPAPRHRTVRGTARSACRRQDPHVPGRSRSRRLRIGSDASAAGRRRRAFERRDPSVPAARRRLGHRLRSTCDGRASRRVVDVGSRPIRERVPAALQRQEDASGARRQRRDGHPIAVAHRPEGTSDRAPNVSA